MIYFAIAYVCIGCWFYRVAKTRLLADGDLYAEDFTLGTRLTIALCYPVLNLLWWLID